ncbi:hypothetical protein F511_24148 [Dorcoceras hygrometricum]|uniref:Uncharacterized protein n=1 Tax=Dorcoceras hygrometricum TaxID=472368 RepID=A0A2Z7BV43_9LAMI|nr:hypothetical protein F511_24148 [Dorcoceras hygrometricum]
MMLLLRTSGNTVLLISLLIKLLAAMRRVDSYHALMSSGNNRSHNLAYASGFPGYSAGRGGESAGDAPKVD